MDRCNVYCLKAAGHCPAALFFVGIKNGLIVVNTPYFKFFAFSTGVCAIILHSMMPKIKLYL